MAVVHWQRPWHQCNGLRISHNKPLLDYYKWILQQDIGFWMHETKSVGDMKRERAAAADRIIYPFIHQLQRFFSFSSRWKSAESFSKQVAKKLCRGRTTAPPHLHEPPFPHFFFFYFYHRHVYSLRVALTQLSTVTASVHRTFIRRKWSLKYAIKAVIPHFSRIILGMSIVAHYLQIWRRYWLTGFACNGFPSSMKVAIFHQSTVVLGTIIFMDYLWTQLLDS